MEASVLLTLKMNETESYKVDLNLPIEAPSAEKPFRFCVTQVVSGQEKGHVLDVAIAGSKMYYARVAPPESLLALAKMDDVVKDLAIQVQDGGYKPNMNLLEAPKSK